MSRLSELLSAATLPAIPANPANVSPAQLGISTISKISKGHTLKAALDGRALAPADIRQGPPAIESWRAELLQMLEKRPGSRIAFVATADNPDGGAVIALAIRSIGTCRLLVPPARFDAAAIIEFFDSVDPDAQDGTDSGALYERPSAG